MTNEQPSVTAVILARNEERRIEDALLSLTGWTSQVIVIDNESTDRTAEIARQHGALVIDAPRVPGGNFDALRNLALPHVTGDWIFFLDADERVPPRLGPALLHIIRERGGEFAGLMIPFKHFFAGKWIEHSGWWPGYTRCQLVKYTPGRVLYNERLHSGVEVGGPVEQFSAADPDLAIVHLSYDDVQHWLSKADRYTSGESSTLLQDGASHSWQAMLGHFMLDWRDYYGNHRGDLDAMHGFVLAFLSAFYRFASRAKLWDLRRQRGGVSDQEPVPADLSVALGFMQRALPQASNEWLAGLDAAAGHAPVSESVCYPMESASSSNVAAPVARGPIVPRLPGDPTITAYILARNEEGRIEETLASIVGWTDQILLLDHGSTDRTAEIARAYGAEVVPVPYEGEKGASGDERGQSFDGLRNLVIQHATGDWVACFDADERAPEKMGPYIRTLLREQGDRIQGVVFPFKNFFCGKWMQYGGWFPGYLHHVLMKAGRFRYNEGLHTGLEIDGRTIHIDPDPDLAVIHETYDDLAAYLQKLNRYTDSESERLLAEGASHSWQAMLAAFTHEWKTYYETGHSVGDGMHGFVLSFMSAFYKFVARAKLWDLRRKRGETRLSEPVPANIAEMLDFMARVLQEGGEPWISEKHAAAGAVAASPLNGAAPAPLLWRGPLLDASGYADEGRNFVLGLVEAGEPLVVAAEGWGKETDGLPQELRDLLKSHSVPADHPAEICVLHTLPGLVAPVPSARRVVVRTMFETDRLPAPMVARLNEADRVLVPTEFNRETFVRSGVDPDRIGVVPGALDVERFAAPLPPGVAPWPMPAPEPFVFLSVFDWSLHKGWDVLLLAFAREFGASPSRQAEAPGEGAFPSPEGAGPGEGSDPEAGLLLKVWSSNHLTLDDIRQQADALLQREVGRGLDEFPNIHLWQESLPAAEMPRLYRAVHAFVLPTRGEGWCRPLMEAMACGLPTIATAWSGMTAFHDSKVGYPLACRLRPVTPEGAKEIPLYTGHCWAEPDGRELQRLMRRVLSEPEAARKKGSAAQSLVRRRYNRRAVTALLREELATVRAAAPSSPTHTHTPAHTPAPAATPTRPPAIRPPAHLLLREPAPAVDFLKLLGRPLRIRWEGDQTLLSSLALVNREFCLGLLTRGDVELSLGEDRSAAHTLTAESDPRFGTLFARIGAPLSGSPDLTVRHHFPPDWSRSAAGRLVVIQPWEYGHIPAEWVKGAGEADEVWAYSRFVRDVYVRSGVPAEKIRVVPLGFNPDVFRPEGAIYPLDTKKTFRILYVGGTIDRKGADILLQAYLSAFRREDDVCLVVKDMGTRSFYQGGNFADAFKQVAADPNAPEIIYLDQDLTDEEMAALYRACSCVVLPYRGEGFGLSPLEGMGCGKPAIVTSGGPTDDYIDDSTGFRLPQRRLHAKGNVIGGRWPCVGEPWQLDPDMDALVAALRWAAEHPEDVRAHGEAARAAVAGSWTWEAAVAAARLRLRELVCPEPAATAAAPVRWPRRAPRVVHPVVA